MTTEANYRLTFSLRDTKRAIDFLEDMNTDMSYEATNCVTLYSEDEYQYSMEWFEENGVEVEVEVEEIEF